MLKDIVLENSRRKKIYNFIRKKPGIHLREIQRRLSIPLSSLEHHIEYMIRKNIIYKEREGRYTRYFAGHLTKEKRKVISALRHKRLREIVSIVLEQKEVKSQDLIEYLNIPYSTLSYYLKYLVEHSILRRQKISYENIYSIQDQRVEKILIMYEPNLIDKLADKALRTFLETDFKNTGQKAIEEIQKDM
jgi:predicted transcriptional regulator